MPTRPPRRLPLHRLARTLLSSGIGACDDELFDELIIARRYLSRPVLFVSDPDGIRHVMVDNVANYPRLSQLSRVFRRALGDGMLSTEGETWRDHRRLINPTLDRRSIGGELATTIQYTGLAAEQFARTPANTPLDIRGHLKRLVLTMTRDAFARTDDRVALEQMIDLVSHFPAKAHFVPWPHWLTNGLRGGKRSTYPVLTRLIAERREPGYSGAHDLLWRLAVNEDRRTGSRLSDAEIHDEVVALASSSVMTTVRVLTWFWYLLALHPSAETLLHAELDRVLDGRPPAPADFQRLIVLEQTVNETMRLYPPVPIMLRSALAPDTICGRTVSRHTVIVIAPWVIHRHRKLWRHPDRFDPDRFSPDQMVSRSRYAFLPFSTGPRVCVGESLADMQLRVIIAMLAQRFRFRLVPGHPVEPSSLVTLLPRRGMKMTVEPR